MTSDNERPTPPDDIIAQDSNDQPYVDPTGGIWPSAFMAATVALSANRMLIERENIRRKADLPPEAPRWAIRFERGARVAKFTGDAPFTGTVVAWYFTSRWRLRYVVEVDGWGGQMIESNRTLRALKEESHNG